MIEEGALEFPRVDAVFGLHADPLFPAGEIRIAEGFAYAASDMFVVIITAEAGAARTLTP